MRREHWYNDNGVIKNARREEFETLAKRVGKVIAHLEGRMTYRDLYDVARDAAIVAVSNFVIKHVNSKPRKRK